MPCDAENFLYVYDHTVKPVLLYASEVVGMFKPLNDNLFEKVYKNLPLEKLNLSLCRYILSVNKKTSKLALYGELGRYPMYVDVVLSMLKYVVRLKSNKTGDNLLYHAFEENLIMVKGNQNCWLSSIQSIVKKFNLFNFTDAELNEFSISLKRCDLQKLSKSMKNEFETIWFKQLQNSEKLRTYRTFKTIFKFENYIKDICNVTDRYSMSRYRTSNHRLQIELGRYTIPKTPVNDRICKNCPSGEIEDEKHILLNCDKYTLLRQMYVEVCFNKNSSKLDNSSKLIWLMSNEDANICRNIARFLSLSIFNKSTCSVTENI